MAIRYPTGRRRSDWFSTRLRARLIDLSHRWIPVRVARAPLAPTFNPTKIRVFLPVLTTFVLAVEGPVLALSERDCAAAWAAADADGDGFLTVEEGSRYLAAIGASDKSIADGKLSYGDFMAQCHRGLFDALQHDTPALQEGANSFTEQQAKERVLARGYRNVSSMHKDPGGIWRGTAELNGIKVNVAVDYKGNVAIK